MFHIYETTGESQNATSLCPRASLRTTLPFHNTLNQHPTEDRLNPGPVTASSSRINTIVIILQLAFIGIEVLAFNALR